MTEQPNSPGLTSPASLALAGAGVWLAAHFGLHVSEVWWSSPAEGEWDVLLTSRAIAAGNPPPGAVGSLLGFEAGSYLTAAATALAEALGATSRVASRFVGAGVGAALAAIVVLGSASLSRGRSARLPAAALGTLAVAFCWPLWHFLNIGVTGTSMEATVLLTAATLVAVGPPGPRRPLLVGVLGGAALLYSPLALTGLPLLAHLALTGEDGRLAAKSMPSTAPRLVLGLLAPVVLVALIVPGGVDLVINIGWFYRGGVRHLFGAESSLGAGSSGGGVLVALASLYGPGSPFEGVAWPRGLLALGLAVPAAAVHLAAAPETSAQRRLGAATLYWAATLTVVLWSRGGFPESYRYCGVYGALGLVCVAVEVGRVPRSRLRWGLVGLPVLVLGAALATGKPFSPPPGRAEHQIMTTLGVHRTPQRLGVRDGLSERHGTFIELLPNVPAEHRIAFAQGYGLDVADDLSPPGMIPWWPQWDLELLRPEIDGRTWGAFLTGLGCGAAVQPELNVDRLALLDSLHGPDEVPLLHGAATCAAARWPPEEVPARVAAVRRAQTEAGRACAEAHPSCAAGEVVPALHEFSLRR